MSFDMVKYYQANTIKNYEQNYRTLRTVIEAEAIDLVICDHNAYACHDVVRDIKIPYIVTMVNNDAPATTETLPYTRRFYEAFVWPLEAIWHLVPGAWKSGLSLQPFGITFFHQEQQWDGALKLVNNLFGFDDARPRGPLVEHDGPIYGDHALSETLDQTMAQFLDTRKKVVYMAFGQHAQSSSLEDSTRLLRMLFDNYEDNVLDGFIWSATRGTPLPEKIISKSGTTYAINDTTVGWITSWAPQTAILRHSSVITFVSHGGAMSVFEAAYHGKRMLFCPFFVDQFANAKHFEHSIGARLWFSLEHSTIDEMAKALRRVVEDQGGVI
ncbi:hypothetical protein RO3G_04544 [Lichtheimia corymbifera JMRC:FSU:9682]|uniref:Glycosyltransferase family 1 protein n=1 Tax=Lichtheimia corymbifera JMRC:FSU:9682 TaxID=1263082 RepID=A0A068RP45_9FUNG|nr:hypothetical protein RO3G_04544 [Lichtheimia corymbifera JMRC:FSU:9682]